jgi:hypothetical protein
MDGGRDLGGDWMLSGAGPRRALLKASLTIFGLSAVSREPARAHHHHKRRRKRCDKRCQNNHRTCRRGCDILDDDSEERCKQGCRVALSQCRSNC